MRWLIGALALLALGYGALLLALWFGQERLLFVPTPLPPDHRLALEPGVEERWIEVPGARLHALHLKLAQPRGLVFFLHGNAGNLETWFVNLDTYRRAGYDLFMFDFRGYGKSGGRIESEAQLMADVRAAWASVAPAYAGRPVVVFGRSLGSGLAAQLAAEVQPALTVMVSPYRSMLAMAELHYPWVPRALLRYPLRSDLAVPRIGGPLLLVHGERDALIPPAQARALQALNPGARLEIVAGAAHGDLQDFEAYRTLVREALQALPAR